MQRDGDVRCSRTAHDHGRAAVDERVEAAAGRVVACIRLVDDGPGERVPQLDEIVLDPDLTVYAASGTGSAACSPSPCMAAAVPGRSRAAPIAAALAAKMAPTRKATW